MGEITLKINGFEVKVPNGSTILEAARLAKIQIPTLCWLKDINEIGACRMCEVEIEGVSRLATACITEVEEGMDVRTHSPKVMRARRNTLRLILSNHDKKCLSCVRNEKCELQALCKEYGVEDDSFYGEPQTKYERDTSSAYLVRDNNKCILCRRCVSVCKNVQGIGVIGVHERGFDTYIGSPFGVGLAETSCIGCGQCITVCPTGALYEKDATDAVFEALSDPEKFVVVQTAPAVRASLGEFFGYPIGTNVQGKMAAALRRLGFDKVFDTSLGADLTILEEANEFMGRLKNNEKFPMITSCSPGWINYCELYYPDLLPNLSTCKSPQQMFGAVAKTYYAQKLEIDPKQLIVVSVMPCVAKKGEIAREHQNAAGVPDVDYSLTTRELGRMIEKAGICFTELEDEAFDMPLGLGTGAAVIFGATGGVMEAALRTVVKNLTGNNFETLDMTPVRGMEGVKEASYSIGDVSVKVAVVSGLGNARRLLELIRNGKAEYHFVEIMACPGGCINGGGQPQQPSAVRNFENVAEKRAKVLYDLDLSNPVRESHENELVKKLYEEFLGSPGSVIAHDILHTEYKERKSFEFGD